MHDIIEIRIAIGTKNGGLKIEGLFAESSDCDPASGQPSELKQAIGDYVASHDPYADVRTHTLVLNVPRSVLMRKLGPSVSSINDLFEDDDIPF